MTKKLTPAILATESKPRTYLLEIEVAAGSVSMKFTNRDMANQEYQRVRGQGIYLGHWIKNIELKDEIESQ